MNSNRLEHLLKYYQEDPDDPFIIYGLAMEYFNSDLGKSKNYFEILLEDHPEYLPTYYQVAHLYEALNELTLAKEIYNKGIALAQKQNDLNTLRELKNALSELEFD